jgi:hypothetical protein
MRRNISLQLFPNVSSFFRLFRQPKLPQKIVAAAHCRRQDLALRTLCRLTHVVPRTISLNIKGANLRQHRSPQQLIILSQPSVHQLLHPPQNLTRDMQRHQPLRPPLGDASPAPASTQLSKTFTLGRAKTDTATVAQEVAAAVADQEMLEGLFSNSVSVSQ